MDSVLYQYLRPPSAVYSFHGWLARTLYRRRVSFQLTIAVLAHWYGLLTSSGANSSSGLVHCVTFVMEL